mgnify:CR=1 FL=1
MFFGQENVTLVNETNFLVIELDEKIRWEPVVLIVALFIMALTYALVLMNIFRGKRNK